MKHNCSLEPVPHTFERSTAVHIYTMYMTYEHVHVYVYIYVHMHIHQKTRQHVCMMEYLYADPVRPLQAIVACVLLVEPCVWQSFASLCGRDVDEAWPVLLSQRTLGGRCRVPDSLAQALFGVWLGLIWS